MPSEITLTLTSEQAKFLLEVIAEEADPSDEDVLGANAYDELVEKLRGAVELAERAESAGE